MHGNHDTWPFNNHICTASGHLTLFPWHSVCDWNSLPSCRPPLAMIFGSTSIRHWKCRIDVKLMLIQGFLVSGLFIQSYLHNISQYSILPWHTIFGCKTVFLAARWGAPRGVTPHDEWGQWSGGFCSALISSNMAAQALILAVNSHAILSIKHHMNAGGFWWTTANYHCVCQNT